jgi:hypothetical protein
VVSVDLGFPRIPGRRPKLNLRQIRSGLNPSAVHFKKFQLPRKLTPHVLVYAEAAQGFRAGGPNYPGGFTETTPPYRSDSVRGESVSATSVDIHCIGRLC